MGRESTVVRETVQRCREILQNALSDLGQTPLEDAIQTARREARRPPDEKSASQDIEVWQRQIVTRALVTALYRAYREPLLGYLRKHFPRLTDDDCEDVVEDAVRAAADKHGQEDSPATESSWKAWLYKVTLHRAIDKSRIKPPPEPSSGLDKLPNDDGTPSELLIENEQFRRRQGLLSEQLRKYCQDCEDQQRQPEQEIFERTLRGQDAQEISKQMETPVETVHELRRRAKTRLERLHRQADPSGSVRGSTARGPSKARKRSPQGRDLVRWAVDEAGALCPTDEQLGEFSKTPEAPVFHHIHYHVHAAVWYRDPVPQPEGSSGTASAQQTVSVGCECPESPVAGPLEPGCARCRANLAARARDPSSSSPRSHTNVVATDGPDES